MAIVIAGIVLASAYTWIFALIILPLGMFCLGVLFIWFIIQVLKEPETDDVCKVRENDPDDPGP